MSIVQQFLLSLAMVRCEFALCSVVSGIHCEVDINECEANMTLCYNEAVCVNQPGTYLCNCSLGYVGEHCHTANCSLGQCVNNGTCHVDDGGRWLCECPEFYTGIYSQSFTAAVLLLARLAELIISAGPCDVLCVCVPGC